MASPVGSWLRDPIRGAECTSLQATTEHVQIGDVLHVWRYEPTRAISRAPAREAIEMPAFATHAATEHVRKLNHRSGVRASPRRRAHGSRRHFRATRRHRENGAREAWPWR